MAFMSGVSHRRVKGSFAKSWLGLADVASFLRVASITIQVETIFPEKSGLSCPDWD
jgi:hypothetical protein